LTYSHTTLAQLRTQLAGRLHDTSKTFWVDAELTALLKEAMRTWQCFTAYWRERAVFATEENVAFYNLPTQVSSLRSFSLTDRNLINDIQYHLLEAANDWTASTAWGGTEQFTMDDVTDALQRRRNQFLAETGCTVTRSYVHAPPPPISRIPLSDDIIDVRRAAWCTIDSAYSILWRSDEWALTAYAKSWSTTLTTPHSFSITATPPVSMQIAPAPLDAGYLELLCVETEADLDETAGVAMNIPDDFCWVVKWGAMADLLGKDGPAADPVRAAYCERMYQIGVDVARQQACVVQAEIQGVPLLVDSLHSLDAYNTGWQNDTGTPTTIGATGLNTLGLSPVPDGVYSITVDVVRDAPVPTADGTQIQLGREELEAVLGYAEHLAMFKVGGPEWEASARYWNNMLQMSLSYNERLAAASRYAVPMADQSRNEKYNRPRRKVAEALMARRNE